MFIKQLNLIFIHCPKSGGNTISEILLPFSDERKTMKGHQDGIDRFEIRSGVTQLKHQTLQDYRRLPALGNAKVLTSLRHPVERLVSWYFSPHRWLRPVPGSTSGEFVYADALFDFDDFQHLIHTEFEPQSHWLTINGQVVQPDFVIDFANFSNSMADFCSGMRIPFDPSLMLNRSPKDRNTIEAILRDDAVRRSVHDSPHHLDWESFPQMEWSE